MNSRKLLAGAVNNWPAKVLSIALALILVVFHRMSTLEERLFSVPLLIEGDGPLAPSNDYTKMVRVGLRGDHNSIYPILDDDIEAFIDLSKYTEPGTYRIPVQVRKRGNATGFEPLEITIDPLEISLDLDRKISKLIPLRPKGSIREQMILRSFDNIPIALTNLDHRFAMEQVNVWVSPRIGGRP